MGWSKSKALFLQVLVKGTVTFQEETGHTISHLWLPTYKPEQLKIHGFSPSLSASSHTMEALVQAELARCNGGTDCPHFLSIVMGSAPKEQGDCSSSEKSSQDRDASKRNCARFLVHSSGPGGVFCFCFCLFGGCRSKWLARSLKQ